ncbi:hypothetical protein C802_00294 [Phocaeicola sartorii]|uniref:Uncharacterized protein n=1 Tax=Phocaeicola sartorii TaxID=671267 RepID=R9IDZ2_9BACT|nr:hypothetical protein C802_00294 [Phocaeicola sartorii]
MEAPAADDVAGTVTRRLQFHESELAVAGVEPERAPDKRRGGYSSEPYAHPLVYAGHVHHHENHEQREKSAGEDEQVPAFEALEFRAASYPLVYLVFRHGQRKNERRIVAATIRKMQAPNQEAAVLEVSGSPDENFE